MTLTSPYNSVHSPPVTIKYYAEDWTSGTREWVFDPFKTDEDIEDILYASGYHPEGTRCHHGYDCCGHRYSSPIQIKRTPIYALVSQYFYTNI